MPTLKAGVAEGRRNVMALARAALSDVLDASLFDGALQPQSTQLKRCRLARLQFVCGRGLSSPELAPLCAHHAPTQHADLEAPPAAGDGSNNVVPARSTSGARAASARLWQRYMREDMRHQP